MGIVLALAGCQAPYTRDAVEAEMRKVFRRSDELQSIAARGDQIVIVGGEGIVIQSPDRGRSWTRLELVGKPAFIDVAHCADGSFVALDFDGAVFVRGAAEVSDWVRRPFPGRDIGLDLTCDRENRIWVVGEFSTIRQSSDGGRSWKTHRFDRDVIFTVIDFVDREFGFVAGEFGSFLVTRDGGGSWEWRPPVDSGEEFYSHSAVFRSRQEGWLVGLVGTVYHTADQGESWQLEPNPVDVPLFGIALHQGQPVVVGGLGSVMTRGSAWEVLSVVPPVFTDLRAVATTAPNSVMVIGGGGEQRRVRFDEGIPAANSETESDERS